MGSYYKYLKFISSSIWKCVLPLRGSSFTCPKFDVETTVIKDYMDL